MNTEQKQSSSAIKPEELKAFGAVLKQNGCSEGDYRASPVQAKAAHESNPSFGDAQKSTSRMESPQGQAQVSSSICVKNQKTGKEKTYQAGSHWVQDFERDLKNQQFK